MSARSEPNGYLDSVCKRRDIAKVARSFGSTLTSPMWDPTRDMTGSTAGVTDNVVNMIDVGAAARHFGEHT